MAKRRKKKKVRQTTGTDFIMVDVDNPMFSADHAESSGNPKRIRAVMNARESPIAWMYAHKEQTGITEAQVAAAGRFRRLYETAGGAGVGSIDYMREPVDGSGITDPIGDRMMDAARELVGVNARLGPAGYRLVEQVCGQCLFISQLTPRRREQNKLSGKLKNSLHSLATFWGLQTPSTQSYRKACWNHQRLGGR